MIYYWTIILFLASRGCSENRFEKNKLHTWKNSTFYAFKGIKYAEAGRFKDPTPYKRAAFKYLKLHDLTQEGSSCPSISSNVINEDCLYLNVYTRNLEKSAPVVVFIHPGGFYIGSGSADLYGPEFLMEKEVVLVTFNYRLGFFGFASTGDARAPGNAGLKDQVLVLKWIKENIRHFGGDPNRITLMGASAGGMSVILHMISKMTEGLFHNAIVISGAVLPQKLLPHNQMDLIEKQAKLLGCKRDPFECLLRANASDIVSQTTEMFEFSTDFPIYLWLPVVEGNFGQQRFLVKDPYHSLLENKFRKVPLLTGCTKDEGAVPVMGILTNTTLLNQLENNFNKVVPILVDYERDSHQSEVISAAIRKFYFSKDFTFADTKNCISDAIILMPVHRNAKIMVPHTTVFYYKFSYNGLFSEFKNSPELPTGNDAISREIRKAAPNIVSHLDDVNYMFTANSRQIYNLPYFDARTVHRLTSVIESFATNGIPSIADEHFIWPSFGNSEEYVNIGKNLRKFNRPLTNSTFWYTVFP